MPSYIPRWNVLQLAIALEPRITKYNVHVRNTDKTSNHYSIRKIACNFIYQSLGHPSRLLRSEKIIVGQVKITSMPVKLGKKKYEKFSDETTRKTRTTTRKTKK